MTVLESRFMERVPVLLQEILKSLVELNKKLAEINPEK